MTLVEDFLADLGIDTEASAHIIQTMSRGQLALFVAVLQAYSTLQSEHHKLQTKYMDLIRIVNLYRKGEKE